MYKSLLALILIFSNVCLAQTNNYSFPKEITNLKTEQHINIPGTRLFIIPPKGFKVNEAYPPAVYNENGINAFIQVNDLLGKIFMNMDL